MQSRDPNDPKGLIREAYAIEGITAPECRSILLDWALSLPLDTAPRPIILALLDQYGPGAPAHPMTETLRAGLPPSAAPRRQGGRKGRLAP
jgi:hypothetical protein